MATTRILKISSIVVSEEFQPRLETNPDHIEAMRTALIADEKHFDKYPVKVWEIAGDLYLVDGFHRVAALKSKGLREVTGEVHKSERPENMSDEEHIQQSRAEALSLAVTANAHFGSPLRRSRADNRKAVEMLLANPITRRWSDARIAAQVGITTPTVGTIRKTNPDWMSDERETASGKKISAERQGSGVRKPKVEPEAEQPEALDVVAPGETQPEVKSSPIETLAEDNAILKLKEINKELQAQNEELKTRVAALEAELAQLKPKAETQTAFDLSANGDQSEIFSQFAEKLAKLHAAGKSWTEASNSANLGKHKKSGRITPETFDKLKEHFTWLSR